MAKRRKKRETYTEAQRQKVLATAQSEGLTAAQVQQRFKVTPVTYYSWRKKSGIAGRRGRSSASRAAVGAGLTAHLRAEVQSKIRQVLPMIVRSEVGSYLNGLFHGPARRRPRRKK